MRLEKRSREKERRLNGRLNEAWKRLFEFEDMIKGLEANSIIESGHTANEVLKQAELERQF